MPHKTRYYCNAPACHEKGEDGNRWDFQIRCAICTMPQSRYCAPCLAGERDRRTQVERDRNSTFVDLMVKGMPNALVKTQTQTWVSYKMEDPAFVAERRRFAEHPWGAMAFCHACVEAALEAK